MATFRFSLPESLSAKDVLAGSIDAVVLFEPPEAFVPANITKSGQEGSESFSVSVQDLPRASNSQPETEQKATLFLKKGDRTLATIPLTEQ